MRFTQQNKMITTDLDAVGMSIGVDRVRNESGYQYVERIYDRYRNPSDSTYDGLVSRVSRKLGLLNSFPFEILKMPATVETTVDGVTVTILENSLTDTGLALDDDEYVGMTLSLNGIEFEIIENTSDTIYVNSNYLEYVYNRTPSSSYVIYKTANPFVSITSSRMRLYSNYINENINTLDMEIELNNATTLLDVYNNINDNSENFYCKLLPIKRYSVESLMSRNIIPQTSLMNISINGNGTSFIDFGVNNILEGSLITNSPNRFINKKSSAAEVRSSGDYFLDRFNGTMYSYEKMNENVNLQVRANVFPFRPKCSLIIIDDIRDTEYQRLIFQQVEQPIYRDANNREKNGKPLDQFFIDYKLLNSINNIHWGE